jgi:hypothetical protein
MKQPSSDFLHMKNSFFIGITNINRLKSCVYSNHYTLVKKITFFLTIYTGLCYELF